VLRRNRSVFSIQIVRFGDWDDSKQLEPDRREILAARIRIERWRGAVQRRTPLRSTVTSILQAWRWLMLRAVRQIRMRLPPGGRSGGRRRIPQKALIHGDSLSFSIGAASFSRKSLAMRHSLLGSCFSRLWLARNKGYGTLEQLQRLERAGPTTLHRSASSPSGMPANTRNGQGIPCPTTAGAT